jgi:quaternary ammonium compound-resistance protein SugE
MAWIYLFAAGVFEIGWVLGLKLSFGFTRLWPSLLTVVCFVISLGLLGLALRTLPLGTAYAVWTGIGAVGAAVIGMAAFGESAAIPRLLCILFIVAGIVGLKLTST